MSHHWTPNQPEDSTWTNNATGSSFTTSAYKVGSSTVQGTRINTNKKLFFGTQEEFSIRFSSITNLLKIDYTDPHGNVKNVFSLDNQGVLTVPFLSVADENFDMGTATYEYEVVQADGILMNEAVADVHGNPTQLPQAGSMVYTRNNTALGKSYFWLALHDTPGGPA
tara:strand:- start:2288 stop:2788 length:501 start_codon:yes stop_codon:yes gene_type:complete